eukprot:6475910-Amphidinium_carterae.1
MPLNDGISQNRLEHDRRAMHLYAQTAIRHQVGHLLWGQWHMTVVTYYKALTTMTFKHAWQALSLMLRDLSKV